MSLKLLSLGRTHGWPPLQGGPARGEDAWLFWLEGATPADVRRVESMLDRPALITRTMPDDSGPKEPTMSTTYLAPAPSIDPAERLRLLAEGLGYPPVAGLTSQGAWTLALAQPTRHAEIEAALDQHARDLQRAADDRAKRRTEMLVRGEVPDSELTTEERSLIASTRAENERIAREYEARRPQRIEALLERIAGLLEGRRVQ